ncbi:MAG: hypothetical protein H0W82_05455 [Actinobacteria bacterium]|nr:hypothetical protein [Actinomycetota bacterium]
MTVVTPFPRIGWTAEGNVTGDPRIPVNCGWCWGAGAVLERLDGGCYWEHVPVRCPNCLGAGTVRIERRRAA